MRCGRDSRIGEDGSRLLPISASIASIGDDLGQRVPVIRIARQSGDMGDELTTASALKRSGDAHLDAELARPVRLGGNRYLGHEFDVLRLKVRENKKFSVGSAAPLAPRLLFKIFQIGFNKWGRKPCTLFLPLRDKERALGRRPSRATHVRPPTGKNLLAGYEQFDTFTDMEYLNDSGTFLEAY